MDDILEFVIELCMECGLEIIENPKISKWIRYPLCILFLLLFFAVAGGIFVLGISIIKENELLGCALIFISIFLLYCIIRKFYIKRSSK